jgi:hypothetical protein
MPVVTISFVECDRLASLVLENRHAAAKLEELAGRRSADNGCDLNVEHAKLRSVQFPQEDFSIGVGFYAYHVFARQYLEASQYRGVIAKWADCRNWNVSRPS